MILTTALTAFFMFSCGSSSELTPSDPSEAWNYQNAPIKLSDEYNAKLADLPLEAQTDIIPWTDSYWPSYKGGLADRWQTGESIFEATLNNKNDVQSMSENEIKRLSPAEKYDILIGNYDYPLTRNELGRTNPDQPRWFGLCHGWAPASINFSEPKPVTVTSVDGIVIPFGSSDIKALLTFLQQHNRSASATRFLGERCNANIKDDPSAADRPECRDTNAGSFHISIANRIGIDHKAFVADVTRDSEVWNQPVFGYNSKVVSESEDIYPKAAEGTVKIVRIKTTMLYTAEIRASWKPVGNTDNGQVTGAHYEYNLEINKDGEIIGGEWLTESRPDFLWSQTTPEFAGFFENLGDVYEKSIQ